MTTTVKTTTLSVFCLAGLLAMGACGGGDDAGDDAEERGATLQPDAAGAQGELPPDHPPINQQRQDAMIAPVAPGAGTGADAVAWDVPQGWTSEIPANTMRRAQYRVPGPGGDAECIVFYFGPGQGGDAMANATRWASQFDQPDGVPSTERLITEQVEIAGVPVLKAEITGTYRKGGPMMGGPAETLPGYMLLGAVVAGPDANWFFKLTGPAETVEANRGAFEGMLASLRAGVS